MIPLNPNSNPSTENQNHHYKLPAYAATTFNVNSLSANPIKRTSPKAIRHKNILKAISKLLANNTFLALQETKLPKHNYHALQTRFPNHTVLYNNYQAKSRGTIIIFHNSILKHYTYKHSTATKQHTEGRIQHVKFNPKNTSTHLPFQIINVYLQADSKADPLQAQLRYLAHIPTCNYTYLLGDFNFTESPADSPSPKSSLLLAGKNLVRWDNLLRKHRLHEIQQPTPTYYKIGLTPQNCRASRIDRIYTSFSLSDLTLLHASAYLPVLPINILNTYHSALDGKTKTTSIKRKTKFSDHLPVSIRFSDTAPSKKRAYNTPRWLADTPLFKEAILDYFGTYLPPESPFTALDRWKKAVRKAAKSYFAAKRKQQTAYTTETAELSAAIKLLRLCTANNYSSSDTQNFLDQHQQLSSYIPDSNASPADTKRLRDHIHSLLTNVSDANQTSDDQSELPESSKPSTTTKHSNLLENLKQRLPATKKRLQRLHDPDTGETTEDPHRMGALIKKFWGKLWAKSTDTPPFSLICKYLRSYPNRISPQLTPALPSLDDISDLIKGSNNSAAGPDGIPFAMYRLCADELAPILHDITYLLATGVTPPDGFNFARLFLIPKDNSHDTAATRPISVTNADNRIIAKSLTDAIAPCLQEALNLSQKGFVPKRTGDDHILALNQAYYSALKRKQQHYILFLDTKKAFDSIHHDFIFAVLDVLNMPQWFCLTIAGLLHNVQAHPVLSEDTKIAIPIRRGVKQGCPLSPLLFVMCYDVLLHALSTAFPDPTSISQHAFADDLALSASTLTPIVKSLKIIRTFADYSGLGLNIDKTEILTTRPPSYGDRTLLHEAGFSDIKFTKQAKYLGVLMGSNIDTTHVFIKAKHKLLDRLNSYRPILAHIPLHQKIIIINVFILPIIYYLAQYFIIPYHEVVIPIKLATHRAVVPYNGGGFGYAQLISPRSSMGPHTPMRDLWAHNLALLTSKFPHLNDSHGHHSPQMGSLSYVQRESWNSLSITDHRAHAAFIYLNRFCPPFSPTTNLLDVHRLTDAEETKRRTAYQDIIRWGYDPERSSTLATHRASLPNKLKRVLNITNNKDAIAAANNLCAHTKFANPNLTPTTRNNFMRLAHNALPTDRRRAQARMPVAGRAVGPGSPFPCYLCGKGEDSITHLTNGCEVVRKALLRVTQATGFHVEYNQHNLTLNFPPTSTNLPTNVIIHFNDAVWRQRTNYFATLTKPPPETTAINRITDFALDRIIPSKPRSISTTAAIAALALQPPTTAIVCFTDGSARPNPGPTGAGLFCEGPPLTPNAPRIYFRAAASLGHGDNNLGEYYAIYMALTLLDCTTTDYKHHPKHPPLLIFSDSLLAICFILHGWKHTKAPPIAKTARTLYRKLSKTYQIRLYWVRGHSKVPGNEIADEEAKHGAGANNGDYFPDRPKLTITARQASPLLLQRLHQQLNSRR